MQSFANDLKFLCRISFRLRLQIGVFIASDNLERDSCDARDLFISRAESIEQSKTGVGAKDTEGKFRVLGSYVFVGECGLLM